jgi:hypothetical protein
VLNVANNCVARDGGASGGVGFVATFELSFFVDLEMRSGICQ